MHRPRAHIDNRVACARAQGEGAVSEPVGDFVTQIVELCRAGRHWDAVTYADQHRGCWSALTIDQLRTVWSELISSALARRTEGELSPGGGA